MKKFLIVCAIAWGVVLVPGRAETLEIPCIADTTLHENTPDVNFGKQTFLAVGTTQHPIPAGGFIKARGLLRFDLAGKIPPGATLVSAQLKVKVTFTPGESPIGADYGVHRVLKAWGEGTGTAGVAAKTGEASWNHREKPMTWSQPGGLSDVAQVVSSSVGITGAGEYLFSSTAELLSDVRHWMENPQENFGWMLRELSETTSQTAKRFGSREVEGNAAVLRVEYTVAPSQPIFESIERTAQGVRMTWSGGVPPYQLQTKTDLTHSSWSNLGPAQSERSVEVLLDGDVAFFRVASGGQ